MSFVSFYFSQKKGLKKHKQNTKQKQQKKSRWNSLSLSEENTCLTGLTQPSRFSLDFPPLGGFFYLYV